jgi:hypothetical protein
VGTEGAAKKAADRFFAELDPEPDAAPPEPQTDQIQPQSPPPAGTEPDSGDSAPRVGERAGKLRAVSIDMGPGVRQVSPRARAPKPPSASTPTTSCISEQGA